MDIGILRDFIIVIGGFLILILILLSGVLGYLIYRRINRLTQNIKYTIDTAKQTISDTGYAIKSVKEVINIFKEKKTEEKGEKVV